MLILTLGASRAVAQAPPASPPPPLVVTPAQAPLLRPPSAAPPAAVAPAAAQCRDGAFVVAPAEAGTCGVHGGILVILPQSRTPRPPVAARMPLSAPAAARATAPSEAPAPVGATMRCKDGTYLTGAPAAGRCDAYGGLAAVLPVPRTPPPLPRLP